MENHEKIYSAKISLAVDWTNFGNLAKDLFSRILPLAKTLSLVGLSVFFFLIFQVVLVGVFDRLGVSPKVSLLVSCLFYVVTFAGLAIVGGLKSKTGAETFEANFNARPICKTLIIKRKNQEINSKAKVKS